MKTVLSLAILLLLIPQANADAVAEVRCHEIAFSRSVESRNIQLFASFLDADARFIGSAVNRGKDDIAAAWSAFFAEDGPLIKWRPQFVEVLEGESLALSRGPYRMTIRDESGETIEQWGTFNSVWRRQNDRSWKVVFDAGNAASEPPPIEIQSLLDEEVDCP